jgi:hypothetical protein
MPRLPKKGGSKQCYKINLLVYKTATNEYVTFHLYIRLNINKIHWLTHQTRCGNAAPTFLVVFYTGGRGAGRGGAPPPPVTVDHHHGLPVASEGHRASSYIIVISRFVLRSGWVTNLFLASKA